jgi:hypothetical protein
VPILNIDDATDKCSGGNNGNPQGFFLYKHDLLDGGVTPGTASNQYFQSLWQFVGVPSHGVAPGAAAIPTRATAGALQQVDASGGRTLYLCFFGMQLLTSTGPLYIADRLGHMSGLSGTVTTAQAVNVSAGRYTGAESADNEIWLEIYTAVGATARTITASYTNQAGTAGQTTPAVAFGGVTADEAQRFMRLPMQPGDFGVQSVESVTLSASTGTAGDFGVTLVRTLGVASINVTRHATQRNYLGPDFPPVPVKADACLFFYGAPTATSASSINLLFLEVA